MPNHVRNVIKMQGITELPLFRTYDDGSKGFDFNKMIPMPESLNMDSGSMIDDYAIYYLTDRCTVPVSRVSAEKKAVITKNDRKQHVWKRRMDSEDIQQGYGACV